MNSNYQIKNLTEILTDTPTEPSKSDSSWQLRAILSDECLSYIAWNTQSKEALLVDPKDTDATAYQEIARSLKDYRWVAIIDTHTHADHISCAAQMARNLGAPLIMHQTAPSQRIDLRVAKSTSIQTQAGPLSLLTTPGHTPDSLTIIWGPFIFGGDTILYGDTGRDDLPGGDARAHYESIQHILAAADNAMILLPGHDHKGGRASTWQTQLKVNTSLTQPKEQFIAEASSFSTSAPKLLKESLKENFK